MLKSLFVLVNYFVLAILALFLQKIEVKQILPAKLNPGESTEVVVTIEKGKIQGFAKLQINVDAGLKIEPIENNGASFTFNDQKAKFIWMSVPTANSITIKYKLTALPNSNGIKNIEGTFSYIDENQRLVYDMPIQQIATGDAVPVETANNEIASNQNAELNVNRKVTPLENGRFKVELHVQKTGIEGFAKLQEEIPADYTAAGKDLNGAVFNIVDQKVKFVWFSIPEGETIVVSYEMIPVIKDAPLNFEIDGEFSFLVNNETQAIPVYGDYSRVTEEIAEAATTDIDQHFEELDKIAQAQETAIQEEQSEQAEDIEETIDETAKNTELALEQEQLANQQAKELADAEQAAETAQAAAQAEKERLAKETELRIAQEKANAEAQVMELAETASAKTTPAPVSKAPNPDVAISYRVQITAGKKVVDKAYFSERHKFTGEFMLENHQGWVKYTTGKFENYQGARNHRNQLVANHNFPGPFVAAYNDGERITVQEALMISNQKWIP
jgi:hypothetical protein